MTRLNQELTQRNLYLEQQVKEMSEALYDRRHAAERLKRGQLRMLSQYHLIPAKVVDNTTDRSENFITIDKGSADGVRKDMGVACGNGVVGIVYLVSRHYSVIISALMISQISVVPFRDETILAISIGREELQT